MKNKQQRITGMANARDGVIRWASWLAAMALSAVLAIPLDAEVIDDFEDGVKFLEGGGGMDYFAWDVTGGQLVVSNPSPVPSPHDNVVLTYDNLYWPVPGMTAGILDAGRTLELRMDFVHAGADDLFLLLMCGGSTGGEDCGYGVAIDQNEVALMKYKGGSLTLLYWDTLQTQFDNIIVRLAFRKIDSGLDLFVTVADKRNAGVTLYEKSFTDGPGQDAPMPPPDPRGIGFWTADEGAPNANFTYAAVGVWQVIRTEPPPLEVRLDNLEYDVYSAPEIDSVRLSWSANLVEDQIMVGANSLAGDAVWAPCPEPIFKRFGSPCVSVSTRDGAQFFKLVPGTQFIDDFDPPQPPYMSKGDWTLYPFTPGDSGRFVVANTGSALRLRTVTTPGDGQAIVLPPGPDVIVRDFCVSVDILAEDGALAEDTIGIVARWQRPASFPSDSNGYVGGMALNPPGKAYLFIWDGVNWDTGGPRFTLDEAADYRLQFSGVGNNLAVRLINLTSGQPAVEDRVKTGTMFQQGLVGFWIHAESSSYDFTLDNFFATGTRP